MWRDDAYLLDMLIAARRALEFSRGLTWEQFEQSDLHQHAIAKALENIGKRRAKSPKKGKLPFQPFRGRRSLPCGIALRTTTSASTWSRFGRSYRRMSLLLSLQSSHWFRRKKADAARPH